MRSQIDVKNRAFETSELTGRVEENNFGVQLSALLNQSRNGPTLSAPGGSEDGAMPTEHHLWCELHGRTISIEQARKGERDLLAATAHAGVRFDQVLNEFRMGIIRFVAESWLRENAGRNFSVPEVQRSEKLNARLKAHFSLRLPVSTALLAVFDARHLGDLSKDSDPKTFNDDVASDLHGSGDVVAEMNFNIGSSNLRNHPDAILLLKVREFP